MLHARKDYNRIQDPLPEFCGGIPAMEPVFLLRAKDECAPDTLLFWAEEVRKKGGDPEIIEATIRQAQRMILWQLKNGMKVPDFPRGSSI